MSNSLSLSSTLISDLDTNSLSTGPCRVNHGRVIHPLNWNTRQIQGYRAEVVDYSNYVSSVRGEPMADTSESLLDDLVLQKDIDSLWYWAKENNRDEMENHLDKAFKNLIKTIEFQLKQKIFIWYTKRSTREGNVTFINLLIGGKSLALNPQILISTERMPFLIYNSLLYNTELRGMFRDISWNIKEINDRKDPRKWGAIDGYNLACLIALAQVQEGQVIKAARAHGLSLDTHQEYKVHLVTPATPQIGLLLFSATISSRYLAAFLSSSLDRFDKDLVIRKEFFDLSPTRIQEKRRNLISRFAGIMEAAYMNHKILGLLNNSRNTVAQGTPVPTAQRRPDGILKYNHAGGAESANQVRKKNRVAFPPGVKLG
ncbi:uncharacterized protein LAJ45_10495 [Morchella importuna]|uniref:Uncharacterized protein n=1 Tax=Morchella conica CCBAS932 TaxID=1392247 RepID=A0A3N4L2T2_9PEZI|nr:uncharacterized protein LAJ45_10495 [Morchella importuna]KAH8145525.1 hypothetical protein LAJ45_10495 [Morchella importuna]RPB17137.1 hypothetical protein P167DRAFT_569619 [Morchella conica CCBAS932]